MAEREREALAGTGGKGGGGGVLLGLVKRGGELSRASPPQTSPSSAGKAGGAFPGASAAFSPRNPGARRGVGEGGSRREGEGVKSQPYMLESRTRRAAIPAGLFFFPFPFILFCSRPWRRGLRLCTSSCEPGILEAEAENGAECKSRAQARHFGTSKAAAAAASPLLFLTLSHWLGLLGFLLALF